MGGSGLDFRQVWEIAQNLLAVAGTLTALGVLWKKDWLP